VTVLEVVLVNVSETVADSTTVEVIPVSPLPSPKKEPENDPDAPPVVRREPVI